MPLLALHRRAINFLSLGHGCYARSGETLGPLLHSMESRTFPLAGMEKSEEHFIYLSSKCVVIPMFRPRRPRIVPSVALGVFQWDLAFKLKCRLLLIMQTLTNAQFPNKII